MGNIIKFLTGLILLPTAFFVLVGLFDVAAALLKAYKVTVFFLLGGGLYVALHLFIYDFSRFYVLAHEFTHALSAMLCGYKVSDVNVKQDSGSVKVSGANVFVLLSPYIIPFYAVLTALIYFALGFFYPVEVYRNTVVALLGFFAVMHFIHTYKALTEVKQPDVNLAGGSIFSFSLIILFNAVIITALIEFCFPGLLPVKQICKDILSRTLVFWQAAGQYAFNFIRWAASR